MTQNHKQLFAPTPPFNAERRARDIRDAIAKRKIKRSQDQAFSRVGRDTIAT